ncbi:hypothetical protein J2W25_002056 [Variovorax boronicumulans]|uniref:Uncharacterized protein n=1 Tax=Variovorax boronicumulans TaxID=436515 RepID=A0AAW8DU28_9BURK|nr:hypothetical protein [Variovorax boronicumulans]MDP9877752.1 hypothetical protein [Variovorax boronicumulans]MDP9923035.1 hypothetical protein [Variovorax boronicumulans]
MSTEDEVKALQAAGIPVDSQCNAKTGLLFVRPTTTRETNIFRWFAEASGPLECHQKPVDSRAQSTRSLPGRSQREERPQVVTRNYGKNAGDALNSHLGVSPLNKHAIFSPLWIDALR